MIIIIFLVCVAVIVLGVWVEGRGYDMASIGIILCGVIGVVISLSVTIVLLMNVSELKVIDEKIEIYQEENIKIEIQISECIKQYQQYETNIFEDVASENAITLVSLYPELKSDKLISKQIDIYVKNNDMIKEFKVQKMNKNIYKWWLYFGGK